jgi:energy-coupling factor transporter ATP-binding protein EcfA2
MATIRRVTIHRLRNVKPGSTFELHPGLNVLLGQNGTGKTTLLQWMADFMSGNLEPWSREPYRVEVEFEAAAAQGIARIELTIKNELSELTLTPTQEIWRRLPGVAARPQRLPHAAVLTLDMLIELGADRYVIHQRPSHVSFLWNDQLLARSGDEIQVGIGTRNILLHTIHDAMARLRFAQMLEGAVPETTAHEVHANLVPILDDLWDYWSPLDRFDESLVFFHRIVEGREAQAQLEVPAFDDDEPSAQNVPLDLVALAAARVHHIRDGEQMLGFEAEEVGGFLATAVRLFQYRSATVHLALLEKGHGRSKYGNLRFTFQRHDGSIIGHELLSYGQKRMLSFLYYLALNPRLIIVDELVNGLHHAWINACIDEIGDRQGLLTSQNPLLLDYLTFDSADEVRWRFLLCRSERENGREQLVWRNPTQEEAESFFRAYQAGIQHVGEILVDKGLW